MSAGESLLTAASSQGFYALMTKSFGSQIRGGESSCRVRLSTRKVLNPGGVLDVAVALNWEDFRRFGAELPIGPETVLIHEAKAGPPPADLAPSGRMPREVIGVPLAELAKSSAGTDRAKTTVVLGLLSGWFGVPRDALDRGLQKKFAQKGEGLLEANRKALGSGIAFAAEHPLASPHALARPAAASPKMLCDGNEMCASGAIFSGCEFFGGYPITPSTEVMQILSRELPRYGGVVLQAEDEISGVGAAVGASFAGKKSMTATSGPGMSLKTEVLGLASIAELPLVLLNVQRGGPSTGMPTKPEQADLFQAAFSAHGDVLRPVLAPTSAEDTFRGHRGGLQPGRAVPDAGRHPLRPGDRPAQGDRGPHRRLAARGRGAAPPDPRAARGRVPALRSDAVGREPPQPPWDAGRKLPCCGHRARREGRSHSERRHSCGNEREALPEARPAAGARRISSSARVRRMPRSRW